MAVTGVAPATTTLHARGAGLTETTATVNVTPSPAINVWTGVVEASSEGASLRTDHGLRLALPASDVTAGTRLAAAFRPEHVVLDGVGPLEARVSVVEPLGPETYVYLDVGGTRVCARVDRTQTLAPGDPVRCDVAASAIHVFDASNGARLSATS